MIHPVDANSLLVGSHFCNGPLNRVVEVAGTESLNWPKWAVPHQGLGSYFYCWRQLNQQKRTTRSSQYGTIPRETIQVPGFGLIILEPFHSGKGNGLALLVLTSISDVDLPCLSPVSSPSKGLQNARSIGTVSCTALPQTDVHNLKQKWTHNHRSPGFIMFFILLESLAVGFGWRVMLEDIGQQTMTCDQNLACCLCFNYYFFKMKFKETHPCLFLVNIVYGCFVTILVELRSCERDHVAHKL